jgi:hypothetical protein
MTALTHLSLDQLVTQLEDLETELNSRMIEELGEPFDQEDYVSYMWNLELPD